MVFLRCNRCNKSDTGYILVQHAPVYCTRLCFFALGCASGKTTNSYNIWAHIALLCIQYPIRTVRTTPQNIDSPGKLYNIAAFRSRCYVVAMWMICYNALTTVHYRLLIATNNKLFLVIFTRELQNLERMIQVTYMTSTRHARLVEKY